MLRAWGRVGLVVLAVVLVDQVTKALVVASVHRDERRALFAGIDLVHVRNKGIAFGLFDRGGTVLTVITVAALVLLVGYFAWHSTRPWLWLPTGLLLGGALGNLLDRARDGAVTDFLDPPLWPAFNVADMSITIGVVALLLALDAGREGE